MDTQSTSEGRGTRLAIAVVAVLNAVTAAGGGVCMILGVLSLEPEVAARLPWDSAVVGGVALLLCVAVPNTVLAVLALRKDDRVAVAAVGVGVLLVAWILVQLAFIRDLTFFHPLYLGVGLVLVLLGKRLQGTAGVAAGTASTPRDGRSTQQLRRDTSSSGQ